MVDVRFNIRTIDRHGTIYRSPLVNLSPDTTFGTMKREICSDDRNNINLNDCILIYITGRRNMGQTIYHFLPNNTKLTDLVHYGADLDDIVELFVRNKHQITGELRDQYQIHAANLIQTKMQAWNIGAKTREDLVSKGLGTASIRRKDWPKIRDMMIQEGYDPRSVDQFKRSNYDKDLTQEVYPDYYNQFGGNIYRSKKSRRKSR